MFSGKAGGRDFSYVIPGSRTHKSWEYCYDQIFLKLFFVLIQVSYWIRTLTRVSVHTSCFRRRGNMSRMPYFGSATAHGVRIEENVTGKYKSDLLHRKVQLQIL